MKAVIFAGGLGTRISEESTIRPKPMVEIGNMPILWHIMKIYASHGIQDFVICAGYKGHVISEFFFTYTLRKSHITFDLANNRAETHQNYAEPWRVTVVDTGEETMTGGRLKRVQEFVGDEAFCLTYGDGLSDVNITDLISFHRQRQVLGTVTVVQPPGRFGLFQLEEGENIIRSFKEKPHGDGGGWINGGFFVLEPEVFDYIADDSTVWEQEPMMTLAHEGKLAAYRHEGFWQPMDTLRDKNMLDGLWKSGSAPWKSW